jgi:hypothetical protein
VPQKHVTPHSFATIRFGDACAILALQSMFRPRHLGHLEFQSGTALNNYGYPE